MGKYSIDDSLIFTIIDLSNQLYKNGGAITNKVGLTTQQWLILLYLADDPHFKAQKNSKLGDGAFASEIADVLGVSRPNITNLINILLQKDLIIQTEDESDRRRKKLKLTEKAINVLSKLQPHRERANKKLFAHLEEEEKQNLLNSLKTCLDVLSI